MKIIEKMVADALNFIEKCKGENKFVNLVHVMVQEAEEKDVYYYSIKVVYSYGEFEYFDNSVFTDLPTAQDHVKVIDTKLKESGIDTLVDYEPLEM